MGLKKITGQESYEFIKVKNKLTDDEIYEMIKDVEFPIGKPEISGKGMMRRILFPPGQMHQVQVKFSMGKVCVNTVPAGAGGFAKGLVADALTDGWATTVDVFGTQSDHVQAVADIIKKVLEEKGLLK